MVLDDKLDLESRLLQLHGNIHDLRDKRRTLEDFYSPKRALEVQMRLEQQAKQHEEQAMASKRNSHLRRMFEQLKKPKLSHDTRHASEFYVAQHAYLVAMHEQYGSYTQEAGARRLHHALAEEEADFLRRQWSASEAETRAARVMQREVAQSSQSPTRSMQQAMHAHPLPHTHSAARVSASMDSATWDKWVSKLQGTQQLQQQQQQQGVLLPPLQDSSQHLNTQAFPEAQGVGTPAPLPASLFSPPGAAVVGVLQPPKQAQGAEGEWHKVVLPDGRLAFVQAPSQLQVQQPCMLHSPAYFSPVAQASSLTFPTPHLCFASPMAMIAATAAAAATAMATSLSEPAAIAAAAAAATAQSPASLLQHRTTQVSFNESAAAQTTASLLQYPAQAPAPPPVSTATTPANSALLPPSLAHYTSAPQPSPRQPAKHPLHASAYHHSTAPHVTACTQAAAANPHPNIGPTHHQSAPPSTLHPHITAEHAHHAAVPTFPVAASQQHCSMPSHQPPLSPRNTLPQPASPTSHTHKQPTLHSSASVPTSPYAHPYSAFAHLLSSHILPPSSINLAPRPDISHMLASRIIPSFLDHNALSPQRPASALGYWQASVTPSVAAASQPAQTSNQEQRHSIHLQQPPSCSHDQHSSLLATPSSASSSITDAAQPQQAVPEYCSTSILMPQSPTQHSSLAAQLLAVPQDSNVLAPVQQTAPQHCNSSDHEQAASLKSYRPAVQHTTPQPAPGATLQAPSSKIQANTGPASQHTAQAEVALLESAPQSMAEPEAANTAVACPAAQLHPGGPAAAPCTVTAAAAAAAAAAQLTPGQAAPAQKTRRYQPNESQPMTPAQAGIHQPAAPPVQLQSVRQPTLQGLPDSNKPQNNPTAPAAHSQGVNQGSYTVVDSRTAPSQSNSSHAQATPGMDAEPHSSNETFLVHSSSNTAAADQDFPLPLQGQTPSAQANAAAAQEQEPSLLSTAKKVTGREQRLQQEHEKRQVREGQWQEREQAREQQRQRRRKRQEEWLLKQQQQQQQGSGLLESLHKQEREGPQDLVLYPQQRQGSTRLQSQQQAEQQAPATGQQQTQHGPAQPLAAGSTLHTTIQQASQYHALKHKSKPPARELDTEDDGESIEGGFLERAAAISPLIGDEGSDKGKVGQVKPSDKDIGDADGEGQVALQPRDKEGAETMEPVPVTHNARHSPAAQTSPTPTPSHAAPSKDPLALPGLLTVGPETSFSLGLTSQSRLSIGPTLMPRKMAGGGIERGMSPSGLKNWTSEKVAQPQPALPCSLSTSTGQEWPVQHSPSPGDNARQAAQGSHRSPQVNLQTNQSELEAINAGNSYPRISETSVQSNKSSPASSTQLSSFVPSNHHISEGPSPSSSTQGAPAEGSNLQQVKAKEGILSSITSLGRSLVRASSLGKSKSKGKGNASSHGGSHFKAENTNASIQGGIAGIAGAATGSGGGKKWGALDREESGSSRGFPSPLETSPSRENSRSVYGSLNDASTRGGSQDGKAGGERATSTGGGVQQDNTGADSLAGASGKSGTRKGRGWAGFFGKGLERKPCDLPEKKRAGLLAKAPESQGAGTPAAVAATREERAPAATARGGGPKQRVGNIINKVLKDSIDFGSSSSSSSFSDGPPGGTFHSFPNITNKNSAMASTADVTSPRFGHQPLGGAPTIAGTRPIMRGSSSGMHHSMNSMDDDPSGPRMLVGHNFNRYSRSGSISMVAGLAADGESDLEEEQRLSHPRLQMARQSSSGGAAMPNPRQTMSGALKDSRLLGGGGLSVSLEEDDEFNF